MEYVTLNNGIKMPKLGYGVYQTPPEDTKRCVLDAIEVGYRSIDTAQAYGNEEGVGQALAECGLPREEFFLTTKVWITNTGYEKAKASIEDSMQKLGTDYLDLLLIHQPFGDYYGTYRAMEEFYEAGKIRAIGASNVTADIIRGYCKYGQLDVIQEKYSLLTRRVEKQLLPTCRELGVSVQAYSPLEQGLLTGKVTMDTTYPEGSTRNTNPCFQPARRAQALDMLAKWGDLTEKYDCSLAQLVIALTARMIPGLHVLCGARTPQQVMDNAGALNIKLDGADAVRMKWDVDAIS